MPGVAPIRTKPSQVGANRVVARALIIAPPDQHLALEEKLGVRGYHCTFATTFDDVEPSSDGEHPDVVILIGPAANDSNAATGLRAPVMVVGGKPDAAQNIRRTSKVVVDSLPEEFNDLELFARVHALVRLNTMREELDRRFETSAEFIYPAPVLELPEFNSANARIVFLGSDSDYLGKVMGILPSGAVTTRFGQPYEALACLTDDSQDALVVVVRPSEVEPYLELFSDIRGNSRLYNLPIILVVDGPLPDADAPYNSGATAVFRWPDDSDQIRAHADLLVLQDRYRMAMWSAYRHTHDGPTRDDLTGLYTRGFLHEHLSRHIRDAQAGRKHLTLGYFEVDGLSEVNTNFGYAAGDKLLRQVGGIVNSLVRAEDVPGRNHSRSFCVIMPETPNWEGQVALNRIGGVISNMEFALIGVDEPVFVSIRNGSAGLQDGDTPETLIDRAREDMS